MSQNQCVGSVEAVTKGGATVEGALYERPADTTIVLGPDEETVGSLLALFRE